MTGTHSLALINREGVRARDGKNIQGTSAVYSWITSVHGLNIGVYFDFIIDFRAGFCQYLMFFNVWLCCWEEQALHKGSSPIPGPLFPVGTGELWTKLSFKLSVLLSLSQCQIS